MSAVERFGGKVALITGGGTGIGAAIAELLASEGAKVAICGRRAEVIQRRADQLTAAGYTIHAIVGDVSTDAGAIVQETVETFGRLDILVNNAAITAGLPVEEMTLARWQHVVAVNLDAAFALVHHALPHLIAAQGNILHISSISAISGEVDDVAYVASKAGLEGFNRKLALELAASGVRSNVIRPGLIHTEAFDAMPRDFFESQVPLIPLGRIGRPEDIAQAAAFLCSDAANFITGSVLTIDGGESAR
ncbi:MAG TPA: SDR family NAD(P)-dependent oxidoreductase [Caldilineaceae bacterium]|nr:SDR family NAD(P)-dependent oxidoreductase [Caldilineaceae bacterium]